MRLPFYINNRGKLVKEIVNTFYTNGFIDGYMLGNFWLPDIVVTPTIFVNGVI